MKKLLAAALVLLLSACTTVANSQAAVQLLVFGSPDELAAYRALASAYPGGQVQLIETPERKDLITRLSTSIAGGSPPDVFLMNYRFYGQFAAKNAIEPVDSRLAGSTVIKGTDFYPMVMDAFRWQGKQLCMPQNVSSLAVYYNRDLFKKFGVAEPRAGWTWNDFLSTAIAMTRDQAGVIVKGTETEGGGARAAVHGVGILPSINQLAPLVWSNGGEIVDDGGKPARFTLDTPQAREALRNLVDLRLAYGVVPTDAEVEAEPDEARFSNGRLAMMFSSRRSTTTFRKANNFDWDVAALPVYDKPVGVLHSDAYCITRGSRNKDAAWRFVEFAMSAEGQRIIAATGRTVPSNVEVSKSPAFLDGKAPKNSQVFLDAIPAIRQLPTISTWPEIEDITAGILENALHRGDKLDDVIAELDKQTRPIFARGEGP